MEDRKKINEIFKPDLNKMLTRDFYLRPPEIAAKKLIGKVLVKAENNKIIAARIVETEAYLSENDLASHSAGGLKKRNAAMFEKGGILYVYLIYGIHHCINVVTEQKGRGSAVLIRAAEPLCGIKYMIMNRGGGGIKRLCKGPGNLAKAFGFNLQDNFKSLTSDKLYIQEFDKLPNIRISDGKRIGITKSAGLKLRFIDNKSKFVSK